MRTGERVLVTTDGTELFVHSWLPEQELPGGARAVVQVAHGMAEHAARYEGFARALTDAGYALYADDHRGHGRTAGSLERAGHLADSHGWQRAVEDLATVTAHIDGTHPGVPIILFGHSMGSSMARTYAREYGEGLAALILSGVSNNPGLSGLAGVTAARVETRLRGRSARSPLMDKLLFGRFNQPFTHGGKARTDFEWLSRDHEQVDAYVADPWCGFVCTTTFYADLIAGVRSVHAGCDGVPSDLPILILVGGDDPVGGERAGLQVEKQYTDAGVSDVMLRVYQGGRHELLHETNRGEVTTDILQWMAQRLTSADHID
ncbi:MAG: alpha/beta hydrolase [Dermatophilaceae bacterium]